MPKDQMPKPSDGAKFSNLPVADVRPGTLGGVPLCKGLLAPQAAGGTFGLPGRGISATIALTWRLLLIAWIVSLVSAVAVWGW